LPETAVSLLGDALGTTALAAPSQSNRHRRSMLFHRGIGMDPGFDLFG